MSNTDSESTLTELPPGLVEFYDDVVAGLSAFPKQIPSKYLYDQRGSQLFDEICLLEEYYPTRCEDEIITRYCQQMADQIGPGVRLVEYGSGSSTKTRTLLKKLDDPVAYVPVDISGDHLSETTNQLRSSFPAIEILPVCADFTQPFEIPDPDRQPTHTAVFFPGSTIGNFEHSDALAMLQQISALCGRGGGLLIGIDLQKDVEVIEAAYNDSRGVTAKFNANLLRHINRELAANFQIDDFYHRAVYDHQEHRIEISLVSRCDQVANIGDQTFEIAAGEEIRTEYSHKYTIDGFAELAAQAGLTLRRSWTDKQSKFAVLHFALLD